MTAEDNDAINDDDDATTAVPTVALIVKREEEVAGVPPARALELTAQGGDAVTFVLRGATVAPMGGGAEQLCNVAFGPRGGLQLTFQNSGVDGDENLDDTARERAAASGPGTPGPEEPSSPEGSTPTSTTSTTARRRRPPAPTRGA